VGVSDGTRVEVTAADLHEGDIVVTDAINKDAAAASSSSKPKKKLF